MNSTSSAVNAASNYLEQGFQLTKNMWDALPSKETLVNFAQTACENQYVRIAAVAFPLPLVGILAYKANKKAPKTTKAVIGAGTLGAAGYAYKDQISSSLSPLVSKAATAAQDVWNLLPKASTLVEKAGSLLSGAQETASAFVSAFKSNAPEIGSFIRDSQSGAREIGSDIIQSISNAVTETFPKKVSSLIKNPYGVASIASAVVALAVYKYARSQEGRLSSQEREIYALRDSNTSQEREISTLRDSNKLLVNCVLDRESPSSWLSDNHGV